MANESASIVQKLWNYCYILRDDGVSYSDYVEQLTYLLFLKMADEQTTLIGKAATIPPQYNWQALLGKDGTALEDQYRKTLETLSKSQGLPGVIFQKSQNKIQDPAKLNRLIKLINKETWSNFDNDIKGDIYEGLLQKNAEDTKSGAGQYFTPRSLTQAMVEVISPQPGETIYDPACGTGGFFLAAHNYLNKNYTLDKIQKQFLRHRTFHGNDLTHSVVRLCTMNLYLYGIEGKDNEAIIKAKDSLLSHPGDYFDMVLTNPPFGKKSSITIFDEEGNAKKGSLSYERDGFYATSSNKQLNFLQHVKTLLKINGRAAIVVPDNVLFEGGAGETIRCELLKECDVHTLLRLPTGIFYAQGVKANVLFFDRKPANDIPSTQKLWIYDLRTNKRFTLRKNPLGYQDLTDFIQCYNAKNRHNRKETERFKAFTYEDLIQRDKANLDILWLREKNWPHNKNLPTDETDQVCSDESIRNKYPAPDKNLPNDDNDQVCLAESIRNKYPAPIALAHKRFHDSRFDVYKQASCLIDLFEASFLFIYNLVLADWLKNLDPAKYYVTNSGARRSYKTFALAKKNDFLQSIIRISQDNEGYDLFLSEIVESSSTKSSLTDIFGELKDLRNRLSHTGTASKSKQKKILDEYEPIVLNLLERLRFLSNYHLVRVPYLYRKGGKDVFHMETYNGVLSQIEEKTIEGDTPSEGLRIAEHDHLVLLRNDGKILDLHPLYQLVDNERTQYQSHICFFKQRSEKKQDSDSSEKVVILDGESSHGSETFPLSGVEEFEQLIAKILEKKPE